MSETLASENGVKTYRGSSIEELLPRIREELGPDAVILRRREGLVGGIGGFFQKRCIEVDARPGGPGIDVYDEEPEEPAGTSASDGIEPLAPHAPLRNDAATREGLESPAVQQIVAEAQPFADLLEQLDEPRAPVEPHAASEPRAEEPEPQAASEPPARAAEAEAPEAERPARADKLVAGMAAAGLGEDLAAEIVDAVVASELPFATPARLRTLVRDQLALRIPVAPAAAPGPRTIALVGPAGSGKTAAAARIAAAHAAAGAEVACLALAPRDGGAALRELLADAAVALHVAPNPTPTELHQLCADIGLKLDAEREGGAGSGDGSGGRPRLVVIDTPPAWKGAEGLPKLAKALKALRPNEVHLALRAGTAAAAGRELVEGLRRLRPDRLLPTGLAETDHLGAVADVAIRTGLPLGYLAEGPAEIAPAEPRALASRIVP